jgi:methyl-accepting chemotaxis protein
MKMTIKKKMLFGTVCPILILGIVVLVTTVTIVKPSMKDEIQNSLRATAIATLAAYEQNSGDYFEASNGDVWKGGYNISKSETLVDDIKANSGMDVTFFYGTRRVVTSAVDEDGNRITGSHAGDVVTQKVLTDGEEYFSEAVSIDGVLNYGYYIPVYQKNNPIAPVGMLFVGVNKAQKDAVINGIIFSITAGVAVVMVIGIVIVLLISGKISDAIKKNVQLVQAVADGNLNTWIDEKYLHYQDESGDLARALKSLRYSIKDMVESITVNSDELIISSGELDTTAQKTMQTLHDVEQSVNSITEGASRQAQDTMMASENVTVMGKLISDTTSHVGRLNKNADVMRDTSTKASQTLKSLMQINGQVKEAIETITEQTNQTNESVQKIKEATDIITSIADETSLLSLNASIEAARAGEAGRGFAVVADQIQRLAEQSNEASGRIEDIIHTLMDDSAKAVVTMNQVKDIINEQNESMAVTETTVGEVMGGIEKSLESISVIADKTVELENARNNIVSIVDGLSQTAEQNAASTQETYTATVEMAESFEMVEKSAEKLKTVANTLGDGLGKFRKRK